jgi:cytochrome c biogenesis protein ResB
MRRFWGALKSVRLTVVLLACLATGCVIATLVPQGAEAHTCLERFPRPLAEFLLVSGFSVYFKSAVFLIPVSLFFINLSVCTVDRLVRELAKNARRRHGPDILHFGLMLLVIAAALTAAGRRSDAALLGVGDRMDLPGGTQVTLEAFSHETYADGRPKEWTSTVSVARNGAVVLRSFPIRVNHPLSAGGFSIYQMSHATRKIPVAADVHEEELSGLMVVRDPYFNLVLAALAITGVGLVLTFAQKLGDLPT